MVKDTEGILISCDEAIKQYLKDLDKNHKFIIKDLSENNLFIKSEAIGMIRDEIEKYQDSITFKRLDLNR
jgi:TFIIH basal transcription factor complex TTD-A subunit